jgi:hypothetical protein
MNTAGLKRFDADAYVKKIDEMERMTINGR